MSHINQTGNISGRFILIILSFPININHDELDIIVSLIAYFYTFCTFVNTQQFDCCTTYIVYLPNYFSAQTLPCTHAGQMGCPSTYMDTLAYQVIILYSRLWLITFQDCHVTTFLCSDWPNAILLHGDEVVWPF